MAIGDNTSGTQTATIGTEHTLATITAANVYQLKVDVSNMVGGATPDLLELREYDKPKTGGTERLLKTYYIAGAQVEAEVCTIPRIITSSYRVTLKQAQGTGRAFDWSVVQAQ